LGRKSKTRLVLASTGNFKAYELHFDRSDRERLHKICSKDGFVEEVEDIASRFKSNLNVRLEISKLKERKRFLNILKRRTESLLVALEEGPKIEPHFVSIKAAVTRLKFMGHELSEDDISLMAKQKKIRAERLPQKWLVCGEDLGLSWPQLSYANELISGVRDVTAILRELHAKILNAVSTQERFAEIFEPIFSRRLMSRELKALFRNYDLNVSFSERSRFRTCYALVLEAAGDRIADPRDDLRTSAKRGLL